MRYAGVIACLVWLVIAPVAFVSAQSLDTSIRRTNWDSLFTDDQVHFHADEFDTVEGWHPYRGQLYVDIKRGPWCPVDSLPASWPQTRNSPLIEGQDTFLVCEDGFFDSVIYLDLNHDGKEDAVATFSSGGNGGFGCCAVFLQCSRGPKFVGTRGGSRFELMINRDTVIASRAHLNIQNTVARDLYQIVGNGDSITIRTTVEPWPNSASWNVEAFYRGLNEKRFESSYELLSQSCKKSHAYHGWLDEFKSLQSIQAEVDTNLRNGNIQVSITRVDSLNSKISERRFRGTWRMVWRKKGRGDYDWFLDDPRMTRIK